ncbi:MAG TPA: YciI family protein [Conexibacter sp.]|jgi:hypothetical protein
MPQTLQLLTYDYVADILVRREEHRAGHLGLIEAMSREGVMVMAGAVGDPVDGGAFVLRDTAAVERFLAEDPYVAAGLVVAHAVTPWTVVTPL